MSEIMPKGIQGFQKGHIGYGRGIPRTEEVKKKISLINKGKPASGGSFKKGHIVTKEMRNKISSSHKGKKQTEEHKRKISLGNIGKVRTEEWKEKHRKERHWKWIEDRTQLKTYGDSEERRSPIYKNWSKKVKDRDGWKCVINNKDCQGKVIAHHILSFTTFPELRYELKNGITLCQHHHPRKREDETRLIPLFMGMVGSKEIIWQ
jgi:hypothetical protein